MVYVDKDRKIVIQVYLLEWEHPMPIRMTLIFEQDYVLISTTTKYILGYS
jgi:hypothetical protein